MMSSSKTKSDLYLASCLCDGLEDNNLNQIKTLLLINKANPNVIVPLYGIAPLHLIVGNSSESFADEVTKLFIQHGGNPNVRSLDGMTPVHIAASWGRMNILKILLNNGGDPLSVDDDGKTPFDYAFEGSYYRAISLLNKYYPYNEMSKESLSNDSKANDADDNDNDEDDEEDDDDDDDVQDNPVEFKLEKILINKGDFVAEYVPSEIDTSINKINNTTLITSDYDNSFIKKLSLSNSQEFNYHDDDANFDESHSSCYHSLETINCDDENIIEKISNDNFNKINFHLNKFDTSIVSKSPNFNIININKNQNFKNYISYVNSALIKNNKYNISLIKEDCQSKDNIFLNSLNSMYISNITLDETNAMTNSQNNFLLTITNDEGEESLESLTKNHLLSPITSNVNSKYPITNYDDNNLTFDKEHTSCYHTAKNSNRLAANQTTKLDNNRQGDIVDFDASIECSETSFYSIDEEYEYVDPVKNVAFIERRLLVLSPGREVDEMDKAKDENSWLKKLDELSIDSNENEASTSLNKCSIDNETLRRRLTEHGEVPGPITNTTYHVYLKRLYRLERKCDKNYEQCQKLDTVNKVEMKISQSSSSSKLLTTDWLTNYKFYQDLEDKALREYQNIDDKRKYRGGTGKVSFNYLLLDPRVTNDLPRKADKLSLAERWKIFINSIFYIGKGKAARSVAHLYDASDVWTGKKKYVEGSNKKIQRILDIWKNNKGVICLHVFTNTMQEEAFTREAAMIDTLGTENLSNCNRGNYYGIAKTMSYQDKKSLGKFLLYKAMEIFMFEGERQLFPKNIE